MTDLKLLEKKVAELEERVYKLENDNDWMNQLYKKAEELVVKYDKASAIFLQRKLMIDLERAARILDKLETNGVVGPASGAEPRKILIRKK